ncbi:hypothetical protein EYZ11_006385 [Aspergillus tanneri]|uniref:Uncharacterized protein n=1 Tax=Aspergillus tanneri TaxID=1220188 RepID=A0A4S3JFK0_9EURO|nr:uncharacterized protein ATNIH1004_001833 [Aspergillus tanneri]KAA8652924.1 hypothetical protein ATNIH1004_001833 [Aspergillus tanneri]THC94136.1 hypothetical protein EYZ11_006385 [Aspergillus tanneri]
MAVPEKKIVLITGASSGLGWETVKTIIQTIQPYHIYVGCLILAEGENAVVSLQREVPETPSTLEPIRVDLTSDESIDQCFQAVESKSGRVDVLINNAGISLQASDVGMREAWNRCYDVNVTGTQIMTHTFVPLLLRSQDPRLIFITSGLSSLGPMGDVYTPTRMPVPAGWPKPEVHPYRAYRASKTAMNMVMLEWHWQLQADGVKTWGVSPGFLDTDLAASFAGMAGAPPLLPPSVGAKLVALVVEGSRDADVGRIVLKDCGVQAF